jgi:hypothetical protein
VVEEFLHLYLSLLLILFLKVDQLGGLLSLGPLVVEEDRRFLFVDEFLAADVPVFHDLFDYLAAVDASGLLGVDVGVVFIELEVLDPHHDLVVQLELDQLPLDHCVRIH